MTYNRQHTNLHINHDFLGKQLLLFFLFMFAFNIVADAKNDKNGKKKKTEVVSMDVDPDPLPKKVKPDRHPSPLEEPLMFFGGKSGKFHEGVDISHYQGKIDWTAVASDPHSGFVYLKVSEGDGLADQTYEYNLSEAKRHGLKVGSYHFFRATTSAKNQFENFKRSYNPQMQDLLPVVDVEIMPNGIAKSKFDDCLQDLLEMMEKEYGKKPIIYTGKNFYNKHFYGSRFAHKYKFWIATYAPEQPVLSGNDDYLIWQYSAKGKIKGVKGYVDLNKFVGKHSIREIRF